MKNISELLSSARKRGIDIYINEEKVQLKIPKNIIVEPEFLSELRNYKDEIKSFLKSHKENNYLSEIQSSNTEGISQIPLSFSQESAWVINKLYGNILNRIPMVLRFNGHLDIDALEFSLKEIVNRHQILRTVIKEENGIPYQKINSHHFWQLNRTKKVDQDISIDNLIKEILDKRFDLSTDYMMYAHLISVSSDQNILILIIHHIASDGWSDSIFYNEVIELYKAWKENRKPTLPELKIQYANYAVWQRSDAFRKKIENKITYWEEKLKNIGILDFPADFKKAISDTNIICSDISLILDKDLTEMLLDISKAKNVTLYMFLLTALNIIIHKYTGDDDICIGSPVANRIQKEVEPLIGFFINTIPIRTDLSNNFSFDELLSETKKNVLEAYDHQEVPFEKIVEKVIKKRTPGKHPVFQILFILQNNETPKNIDLNGLELIPDNSFSGGVTEFDLSFTVSFESDKLLLSLRFNKDLFLPQTANQLLNQFEILLRSVVSDSSKKISELDILSKDDFNKLLTNFNNTNINYPTNKTILDIFKKQVKKTPNKIAATFKSQKLTYKELHEQSNQIAHYLQKRGITTELFVAVIVDRSIEMLVILLGILKSGGAYVPIPTDLPEDRIKYIFDDTNPSVIITNRPINHLLSKNKNPGIIDIKEGLKIFTNEFTDNPASGLSPNNLSYIVYTSGSTGRPKAVLTEHHSLLNFLLSAIDVLSITENSRLLGLAPYYFDGSCMEIYLPLLIGASVIIVPQESVTDGYLLQKIIASQYPTHLQATPSALQLLLDSGWKNEESIIIFSGGEPLNEKLKNHLFSLNSPKIWNLYGPTETTLYATAKELETDKETTVGKPFHNYQIYIVDKYDNLAPIGVFGEVLIGGNGVARGYLNAPELNNEKFIKNTFFSKSNSLLYRTGDLGKWTHDGEIILKGRKDNQIKLRGYRIELNEIELVILLFKKVKQCIVVIDEDKNETKRLIAYITENEDFNRKELFDFLKMKLPDYMIPNFIIKMASFPLTSTGKIDKKNLPGPDHTYRIHDNHVSPGTETETTLCHFYTDLLNIDKISIHDNFFELGGTSLLAIRLIAKIKNHFNIMLPTAILFENPTVSLLSLQINTINKQDEMPSLLIKINEKGNKIPIFCTPPVGGNSVQYYELSKHLGEDQPLYGFIAQGLDCKKAPFQTIEDAATAYIDEIEKIEKNNPCYIAGYSFGGKTAYEMTHQLIRRGIKVKGLIIFDIYSPNKFNIDFSETLPANYKEWLVTMANIYNNSLISVEKNKIQLSLCDLKNKMTEDDQLNVLYKKLKDAEFDVTYEQLKGHINVYITNSNISYIPQNSLLDIPIILFKSTIEHASGFSSDLIEKEKKLLSSKLNREDYGWQDFTKQSVSVYDINCNHMQIFEDPYIKQIAKHLKKHL